MFYFFQKKRGHKNQIFVRDFLINMQIGVNEDEKGRSQRVLVNIVIEPISWPNEKNDNIDETVSYDHVVKVVAEIANIGHIHLVETFADRIAQKCLNAFAIKSITVKVDKLDIYNFAIPGVEITRTR